MDESIAEYGVTLTGDFSDKDKEAIFEALATVGAAIANITGQTSNQLAFKKVFGSLEFSLLGGAKDGSWFCTGSGSGFSCDPDSSGRFDARLVVHELGHTFNAIIANNGATTPYDDLWRASISDTNGNWVTGRNANGVWERGYAGYTGTDNPDLWHGPVDWDDANSYNEEFADMFMNWAFNSFADNPAGAARDDWMTTNMSEWINGSQ